MNPNTTDTEKILSSITDVRVEQAARFATLEERIKSIEDLPARVSRLEKQHAEMFEHQKHIGKFSIGDVYRFIGAVASSVALTVSIIKLGGLI